MHNLLSHLPGQRPLHAQEPQAHHGTFSLCHSSSSSIQQRSTIWCHCFSLVMVSRVSKALCPQMLWSPHWPTEQCSPTWSSMHSIKTLQKKQNQHIITVSSTWLFLLHITALFIYTQSFSATSLQTCLDITDSQWFHLTTRDLHYNNSWYPTNQRKPNASIQTGLVTDPASWLPLPLHSRT